MTAYYNEYDKNAAAWLRQLIKNGLIADGEVDDRSIIDVEPGDLKGFNQHHFFAGIGGWSYALRLAGWSDDRPVCTASLPCQPFSCAGKQQGKDDERHLLPHFIELVKQCNFRAIFGEQVPGAIKHGWLDDLYAEMERENYAVGSIVLTAAGAGAPHIRQRLYWVADTNGYKREPEPNLQPARIFRETVQQGEQVARPGDMGAAFNGMANAIYNGGQQSFRGVDVKEDARQVSDRKNVISSRESRGTGANVCGMDDPESVGRGVFNAKNIRPSNGESNASTDASDSVNLESSGVQPWTSPDWIYCRDSKYRPIKSGIKPLVDGVSERMVRSGDSGAPIDADNTQEARVTRLKGYGNAIVPHVAAQFIKAFMKYSDLDDLC